MCLAECLGHGNFQYTLVTVFTAIIRITPTSTAFEASPLSQGARPRRTRLHTGATALPSALSTLHEAAARFSAAGGVRDSHDSQDGPRADGPAPSPSAAGAGLSPTPAARPPASATIGRPVAGVTKARPSSLWDHAEAISGSGGASEEGPRRILGFVVRAHGRRPRPRRRDPENYNPQQPAASGETGGARVTWAPGLGGLLLSAAAAAAARGTGAFCSERPRGAPERRGRRPSPARSVPAHPRGGGEAAPWAGPRLRRRRPALGPPRRA